jgi:hypothetical protein
MTHLGTDVVHKMVDFVRKNGISVALDFTYLVDDDNSDSGLDLSLVPRISPLLFQKLTGFVSDTGTRLVLDATNKADVETYALTLSHPDGNSIQVYEWMSNDPWTFGQALFAAIESLENNISPPVGHDVTDPAPFGDPRDLPKFPVNSDVKYLGRPSRKEEGKSSSIVQFFTMSLFGETTSVAIKFYETSTSDADVYKEGDGAIKDPNEFERFVYSNHVTRMHRQGSFFVPFLGVFLVKDTSLVGVAGEEDRNKHFELEDDTIVIAVVTKRFTPVPRVFQDTFTNNPPGSYRPLYLVWKPDLKFEKTVEILSQVALASIIMTYRGIVHNDLHANNVLVFRELKKQTYKVVLSDDPSDVFIFTSRMRIQIFDWDRSTKRATTTNSTQVKNNALDDHRSELGKCTLYGQCNADMFMDDWFNVVHKMYVRADEKYNNEERRLQKWGKSERFIRERILGDDLAAERKSDEAGGLVNNGRACRRDFDAIHKRNTDTCTKLDLSEMVTPAQFLKTLKRNSLSGINIDSIPERNTFRLTDFGV